MADTQTAKDLRPGTKLRHVDSGAVVTLDRRKGPHESHLPGWWVGPAGGLADRVIDDGTWEVIRRPE